MIEPIRGKVARLLNIREIAINVGTAHGVSVGMYFDVLDIWEQDIEDPDTGEVLGSLDRPKIRVKVTHTQEKLSVASTYRSERVNIGGSSSGPFVDLNADLGLGPLARALMPPKWIKKYETLEKTEETPPFDEEDSTVKVGDPVVQVIDTSETEQENANKE